jgi:tripartite-type tricarboxylate transporter receptor subunit TctC
MKRRLAIAAAVAFASVLSAHAEGTFPDHPLTLVVPYPAGGVADQIARPLAQALAQRLGQPVIIDNRAGANGNIGSAWVARSQPADGYTLLLGSTSTLTVNPALYKSLGYDVMKDLQPVTLTHQMPNVLVVGAATPTRAWPTWSPPPGRSRATSSSAPPATATPCTSRACSFRRRRA